MKVKHLITLLNTMPPDADVTHLWDGEARTNIDFVWLSVSGFVVTAGHEEVCYSNATLPKDTSWMERIDDKYFQTP